jgi:two-component system, NarL family, sensor kinase
VPRRDGRGRWTVARQVGLFALAGALAVALVGFATSIASRHVGEREAIVDARTATLVTAQGLVEPAVTNGLITAQPAAVRKIASVVERDVPDPSLVRVKIWNRDGRIVYSDEPRLEGSTYRLGADEQQAIEQGRIEAEVSDLSKPENRFERSHDKLLEVYLPIRAPNGERLLFEAYYDYSRVSASARRVWRSFAPISFAALVALELVQLPLAYSLARRLRQRQAEREALFQRALDASDVERRRIASDLHDGVAQDLAGVAYTLAGEGRRDDLEPEVAALLERSASDVRASIRSLRSLMVDIYPPNLQEEGLASALTDLLATADTRGVTTALDAEQLHEPVPEPVARLLYRSAQEALRNTLAHARATHVTARVANDGDHASLEFTDDGVGFVPDETIPGVAEGHFGLSGLRALCADAGGEIYVESAPGRGTTVRVEVPCP